MRMTLRWYGPDDPVELWKIRQIPRVVGVVGSLFDIPAGHAWPAAAVADLKRRVNDAGLTLDVIESVPVSDEIKLGGPSCDQHLDSYCKALSVLGEQGVPVVCYNFMPVFDWTRTDLRHPLPDGSFCLLHDDRDLQRLDLTRTQAEMPAWATHHTPRQLDRLMGQYRELGNDGLWANLERFLTAVVPAAEQAGVRLAIHPDDPSWSIFGLPRIMTDGDALVRLTRTVDSPANGVTLCTGSLGCNPANDVADIARRLAGKIHFLHMRNVWVDPQTPHRFHETAHPSACGSLNMRGILRAVLDGGFDGPVRPDHGRDIWGERGAPGYGLHDRALGAAYLLGLAEGLGAPN